MPDWPIVSGADLVNALESLGFAQVRQRGSHVILRRDAQGCAVPLHRELKRGTLAGIVRQAGLLPDEVIAALR